MGTVHEFLMDVKTTLLNNLNSCLDIHFVIGDECCDLESVTSAIMLAYFMDWRKSPLVSESALIVPVINIRKEDFLFHVETCVLLQASGICYHSLVYRDQVNFEDIIKKKRVTVTLVAHQVLSQKNLMFAPLVVQILDRHSYDESSKWHEKNVKLRLEQVASCVTMIAEDFLEEFEEGSLTEEIALALYHGIIFNTRGLTPMGVEAKKRDFIIALKLAQFFDLPKFTGVVYVELWKLNGDVLRLHSEKILKIDLVVVEKVPVCCLPLLVATFIHPIECYNAIKQLAAKYKAPMVVLMGLDGFVEMKQDIGIYWTEQGDILKDVFVSMLINSEKHKGYDFLLEEHPIKYLDIICFKQGNVALWKEDVLPILVDAIAEVKKLNK